MTAPIRLTDDLIREALAPVGDGGVAEVEVAVLAAVAKTRQRRYWWTPLRRATGPLGPTRELRALALALALVAIAAIAAAIIGTRPRDALLGDDSMFHGSASRTGEVRDPGPATGVVPLWSVSLDGPLSNAMPALDGDRLFVADGRGHVTVYSASDGTRGWSQALPRPATSPAIADGILVLGAGDGLYALDASSGFAVWRLPTDEAVTSSPAISQGVVYAGLPSGEIAALELRTGRVLWRTHVGGPITRSPAVAGGLVFSGSGGGRFEALDVATGQVRWARQLGAGQVATPAVRDGVVYTASGLDADEAAHQLFALDAETGVDRWTFASPSGKTLYVGAVGEDLVYAVGLDGRVDAIRDGSLVWAHDVGAPVGSVATLSHGILYVGASNGTLLALDAATGAERWHDELDGDVGPPVVAGGRLWAGTALGELEAFGEQAPASGP